MCGIYLELGATSSAAPGPLPALLLSLLQARGPDSCRQGTAPAGPRHWLSYCSSVLWLQGRAGPTEQPMIDSQGNLLMWNGDVLNREEAFGCVEGDGDLSDTSLLSLELGQAGSQQEVLEVLQGVRGPWAVVYFHTATNSLWFGRDFFGRSSLVMSHSSSSSLVGEETSSSLVLCSLAPPGLPGCREVPALGVFQLELDTQELVLHPWDSVTVPPSPDYSLSSTPLPSPIALHLFSLSWRPLQELHSDDAVFSHLLLLPRVAGAVAQLLELLRAAVVRRVVHHQPHRCKRCVLAPAGRPCTHASVSVLLSGGVDSTLLALLVAEALPDHRNMDLVNVAFQQRNGSFEVPDRLTGRQAIEELQELCPDRQLSLLCVDVGLEELQEARTSRVSHLLHPLNTVLDDSVGCAIWFAARGLGHHDGSHEQYSSPARVLVLGMGIDEQLGGYSRHRAAFARSGHEGLAGEIRMELLRISERNLGRDDRIVSDHGVVGRFPFLDEDFVNFLVELELSLKCDFQLGRGLGEKLVLRLAAHSLGLVRTAREPKRAVQFGSRIAKMENRKEKAHQLAVR